MLAVLQLERTERLLLKAESVSRLQVHCPNSLALTIKLTSLDFILT